MMVIVVIVNVVIASTNHHGRHRSEALLWLLCECAMTGIILQMLPHLALANKQPCFAVLSGTISQELFKAQCRYIMRCWSCC